MRVDIKRWCEVLWVADLSSLGYLKIGTIDCNYVSNEIDYLWFCGVAFVKVIIVLSEVGLFSLIKDEKMAGLEWHLICGENGELLVAYWIPFHEFIRQEDERQPS